MMTKNTLMLIFATLVASGAVFAQDSQPAVGTQTSGKISVVDPEGVETEVKRRPGGAGISSKAELEGGWEAYDATPLSVRRSITVERDGEIYQAHVYTPVLTRRGAVFLSEEQVGEMHAIKEEIRELGKEVVRLREKAGQLGQRYKELIQNSKAGMVETYAAQEHSGRVDFVNREKN
jgi:hypothetical protein